MSGYNQHEVSNMEARCALPRFSARRLPNYAALAALFVAVSMGSAAAAPFEGCPSAEILARFEDFGRTGKMPPDLGQWLGDPKAQYIEPWKAFDNVNYVGVCWVS